MIEFKISLLKEESELMAKIEKLFDFMESEEFEKVDKFEKTMMLIQRTSMRTYWRCLSARIDALVIKEEGDPIPVKS